MIPESLAPRTAAVPTQQIRGDPAFIQKQRLRDLAERLPRLPVPPGRGDIRSTLFVGVYRFF